MIKVNKSGLVDISIFMFPILVAISNYFGKEQLIILLYTLISSILFLFKPIEICEYYLKSKIPFLFILCTLSLGVSTLIFSRFNSIGNYLSQCALLFDVLTLVYFGDVKNVLRILSSLSIILSYISLVGYILNIDIFGFIKANSNYLSIDSSIGGGISTIFEFRHYYAVFLILAILYTLYFHRDNIISISVLIINLLLTYTRNSWIVCIFCIFLLAWRGRKNKIQIKKNWFILMILMILTAVIFCFVFQKSLLQIFNNITSRLHLIFENETTDDILGARGYSLQFGIGYIIQHPIYWILGGGNQFAMQWLKSNPYYYWTSAIDNQFVTTFMNQGFIGICLFFKIIIEVWKVFKQHSSKMVQMISLSTISLFMSMMFFEVIGIYKSIFILFLLLICSLNQRVLNENE